MITAILVQEKDTVVSSFDSMFLSTISLNFVAILCGILLGVIFSLSVKDTITLGIEIGIQNSSMAMLIAISFLQRPEFAVSAGVYGITMYIGAISLLLAVKLLKRLPQVKI